MTWFVLALGAAVLVATADFIIKRHFSDSPVNEVVVLRMLGLCPMSLAVLIIAPWPEVEPGFWWSIAAALPGEAAATFLYMRAIQITPLSLAQPFLAFTPLFALLTGLAFLGELPPPMGAAGILLLAAGAYGLNLHLVKGGWAGPLKAVFIESGSWMMLAVAALYAYTAVLGRKAILHADPWFMLGVYPLAITGVLILINAATGRLTWHWLRKPWPAAGVGLTLTGMAICHFWAISLTQAAYMISVKRMSVLFAVLYGGVFLGEERLVQHLVAGALMVAGAAVIMVFG